jgi:flagellar motor switch protein FliN/FliY
MSDLSTQQQSALCDCLNDLAPALSLALAEQINREVVLELPTVSVTSVSDVLARSVPTLNTVFNLSPPLIGDNVFSVTEETARVFADLIEGNEGVSPPEELSDSQQEQLGAAMSGVARGFANALTNRTGSTVELEAHTTHLGLLSLPPVFALADHVIEVTMALSIPEVLDSELTFMFTPDMAQALAPNTPPSNDTALSDAELEAMLSQFGGPIQTPSAPSPSAGGGSAPGAFANMLVTGPDSMLPRGIDLILDIPLDITVELGRVRMLIKDVLDLASGSIVELDRVAGEPIDVLVNGRLIAKGEVVVIEDNFGIRLTEIVSPVDRVSGLGRGR